MCCDDEVKDDVQMRSNFSSAVAGGEGLFNLLLHGMGLAVVKSPNPREELYEIYLENDIVKIDGNNAICWSSSLDFTIKRSSRSLIGSMAIGTPDSIYGNGNDYYYVTVHDYDSYAILTTYYVDFDSYESVLAGSTVVFAETLEYYVETREFKLKELLWSKDN